MIHWLGTGELRWCWKYQPTWTGNHLYSILKEEHSNPELKSQCGFPILLMYVGKVE